MNGIHSSLNNGCLTLEPQLLLNQHALFKHPPASWSNVCAKFPSSSSIDSRTSARMWKGTGDWVSMSKY